MQLFGLTITRTKAANQLQPVSSRSSIFGFIRESFAGAWQSGYVADSPTSVLAFSAVYSCVQIIATDIAKLRPKLMELGSNDIWTETSRNSPFLPVLRKPNHYQNRVQFWTHYMCSKLLHGNAYVLKERDARGVVTGLYILDPTKVTPMVAMDGSVYYQLKTDNISGLEKEVIVPASEIIHDTMVTLWHPLVGVSPIYACGSSATQGIRIQSNSSYFFENMSRPSGVLTAPGAIGDDTANRLKSAWEANFQAGNMGRLAVLGDGLKYEAMTIPASDAQLIEQLKWTVEDVARCFRVPLYMLGGPNPTFTNVEAMNRAYYTQTLQNLIEAAEVGLDEGLSLPDEYGVEFDLDALIRMDTATQYDTLGKGVGAGIVAPNEARKKLSLPPVKGGDTPYLQQQNYSLAALDKRDSMEDPFAGPALPAPDVPDEPEEAEDDVEELAAAFIQKFSEEAPCVT